MEDPGSRGRDRRPIRPSEPGGADGPVMHPRPRTGERPGPRDASRPAAEPGRAPAAPSMADRRRAEGADLRAAALRRSSAGAPRRADRGHADPVDPRQADVADHVRRAADDPRTADPRTAAAQRMDPAARRTAAPRVAAPGRAGAARSAEPHDGWGPDARRTGRPDDGAAPSDPRVPVGRAGQRPPPEDLRTRPVPRRAAPAGGSTPPARTRPGPPPRPPVGLRAMAPRDLDETDITPSSERVSGSGERSRVVVSTPRSKSARAESDAADIPDGTVRPRAARAAAAPPPVRRTGRRRPRTLGRALLATLAATVAPGAGHIMLNRRRTGGAILAVFLAAVAGLLVLLLTLRRSDLLATVLSGQTLLIAGIGCVAAAVAWVTVIVRTWVLAQPRRLDAGGRTTGVAVVTALCLVVAAPLGYAANLANSSRALLGDVFAAADGSATLDQPRLNLLLVGSDAGPDRTGARTDTMMVASVETATGRTTLFSLPRNIGRAQFPPGSAMAEEFPDGFHDDSDPTSGNYLLNAVYAYGHQFPDLAPAGPTADPGLNMLHETVAYMLGIPIDYYLELNMAGFASIIDAIGGVEIDVGPERIAIGGIAPSGRAVTPDGYIEPGFQRLDGEQALAFARSRTNSSDYVRMGRQRCLIQTILTQKSPTDLLANFQAIASATTGSVSTDIPQNVLPALVSLADGSLNLESVAFDPNLPDPDQSDGRFNTADPNFELMREVVQEALAAPAPPPSAAAAAPADIPETNETAEDDAAEASEDADAPATEEAELTSAPLPVAQSC